ncbi:MAG: hypothetical protein AABY00_02350 [Nanoarchaeota archaeon]
MSTDRKQNTAEVILIYNGPSGWGAYIRNSERDGKNIRGKPPKHYYQIYQVPHEMRKAALKFLSTRVVHLNDQKEVPSQVNHRRIFTDLPELLLT